MSKQDVFEADILKLILNGVAIANLADNAATAPLTQLYVSLHTADVGEAGNQTTNETSYPNYLRVAIARSPGSPAWTVSGTAPTQAVNASTVQFATCGAGSATLTHFAVGTASSGAGKVFYKGALGASLAVANLIRPTFDPGTLVITED